MNIVAKNLDLVIISTFHICVGNSKTISLRP